MPKIDCLNALKEYNDWCEDADTSMYPITYVPRELSDSTITSLAKEVMNLQLQLASLLKEDTPTKVIKELEKRYTRQARNVF